MLGASAARARLSSIVWTARESKRLNASLGISIHPLAVMRTAVTPAKGGARRCEYAAQKAATVVGGRQSSIVWTDARWAPESAPKQKTDSPSHGPPASVARPDDRVRGRLRVVLRAIRWAGQDINSLVVHTMDGPFNYAWERRPDAYKRGAVGRSIAGQGMEADLVHTMDRLFRWGFLTKDWLAPRGEGA